MRFLKNIFFIISVSAAQIAAQIVFLPFENSSGFEGKWELKTEVPNYIAAYLRAVNDWNVVSASNFLSMVAENKIDNSDLEDVSKFLRENIFRFACGGKIEKFSLARYILGEPTLAGYEGYTAAVKINLYIFDALSNQIIFNETLESTINRNGIGINLFGKPTTEKEQFYGMNSIEFGGEDFMKTIVGENFNLFLEKLNEKIKSLKKSVKDNFKSAEAATDSSISKYKINAAIIRGEILMFDIETGETFINLGSNHNLKTNDLLNVYAASDSLYDSKTGEFLGVAEKKIAEIKILEVRAEKLSLGIIEKKYRDSIFKGMQVRKIFE